MHMNLDFFSTKFLETVLYDDVLHQYFSYFNN